MKSVKFNVQTFDKDGNLQDDENYDSIRAIAKVYSNIPCSTLYYIVHHNDSGRKPSKKTLELMKRITITEIQNDEFFGKINV